MEDVLADLAEEQQCLDDLVAPLTPEQWDLPTPAEPWTIRDQITHLAFFDEQAALSATDPDGFVDAYNRSSAQGFEAYIASHLERGRDSTPSQLLAWWRKARTREIDAFGLLSDPDARVPWFGPPMRARTAVIARLMETWAHGLDIADALGVVQPPTDRLFGVAELGVKTFRFSFENRGLPAPDSRVRVALRGATGRMRVWNDEAEESVTGPVEDFCQVVCQRRSLADTHLFIEGDVARRWMEIAQAYAGPPGPGRPAI